MKRKQWATAVAVVLSMAAFCAGPSVVYANHGMENVAGGAKSEGMGGTTIAVGDDTTVMNTNPSAISKLDGWRMDMNLTMMFPFYSFENQDATGTTTLNKTGGKRPIFVMPSMGIAMHDTDSKWSFGLGMYNEGGTGTDYGFLKVDTRFLENRTAGAPDYAYAEYYSMFGFMKITPTVAYNITDKLSIGASPQIGYAMMRMKMPFYMDMSKNGVIDTLFNADMDGSTGTLLTGKIGLLYNFYNMMGAGLAYTTATDINLRGTATMVSPIDQSMANAQSRMTGDFNMKIGWPQSVKAGMFMKMQPMWGIMMSFDVEWLNWSKYFDTIPVSLSNVKMDGADMNDQNFLMKMGWKDQWVYKVGFEMPEIKKIKMRMGYAYGKNPASSSEGAFAIMNPYVEHHVTMGLGYDISDTSEFNMGMTYGFNKKQSGGAGNSVTSADMYNNAPDMRNSTTGMEYLSMSMMVTNKW